MTDQATQAAFTGDKSVALTEQIGAAAKRLEDIATEMSEAKATDGARWQALSEEQKAQSVTLTKLKEAHDASLRDAETAEVREAAKAWMEIAANTRTPSKAGIIGGGAKAQADAYRAGEFLLDVFKANHRDYDVQREGKAGLQAILAKSVYDREDDGTDPTQHQAAWGKASMWVPGAKSTLGATDATGGWIIPNAVVDEFIAPASVDNIYRTIMTVVPGVTAAAVDIPFRAAARTRAAIAAFGGTKENRDLAYNGYTATMYTLAAIYDIGNQFLRQSRGAAERDVMSELAAAFAQGESYYIREGSGSSQPYGYTSALTSGPGAFRSTFSSPSDSTVAGSMAAAIAVAAGALAGRGVKATGAVISATSYWNMLRQGSDNAGFWFATQEKSPASINPGTLISPFGIPVYADADADLEATAAVIDNLVVANWKAFKVYFGQDYRVDSSDQAGTRWDTNLTGFRGEEEMGFDARPAVYAGYAQMITDIVP